MKPEPTDAPAARSSTPHPPRTQQFTPPRGRVFDVMAPGKAPAAPSSRPVVIGHQAAAQHSQVTVSGIGEAEPRTFLNPRQKVAVQPAAVPAAPEPSSSSSAAPEPAAEPATLPPGPTDNPKTAADESIRPADEQLSIDEPAPTPAAPPPASGGDERTDSHDALAALALEHDTPHPVSPEPAPAPANPATFEPPAAEDIMQNAAPPSLDHQVVVSHHSMKTGSTGRVIGLSVLAILFALLILDILLDAGVISSTAIPHTNLF